MSYARSFSLFGASLAAVAVIAPAQAQDAKAVFEARYAEMHAATMAKDMAALSKLLAPEYQMIDIQGGTHDMSEVTERMGQMPSVDPAKAPKTKVLSAAINGNTATVSQQMDMHISRPMEDGSVAELDITILTEDTWVQRGGVWLLVTSDQKDISVAKDGEVVFHQAK